MSYFRLPAVTKMAACPTSSVRLSRYEMDGSAGRLYRCLMPCKLQVAGAATSRHSAYELTTTVLGIARSAPRDRQVVTRCAAVCNYSVDPCNLHGWLIRAMSRARSAHDMRPQYRRVYAQSHPQRNSPPSVTPLRVVVTTEVATSILAVEITVHRRHEGGGEIARGDPSP